jgi:hypothetical protein
MHKPPALADDDPSPDTDPSPGCMAAVRCVVPERCMQPIWGGPCPNCTPSRVPLTAATVKPQPRIRDLPPGMAGQGLVYVSVPTSLLFCVRTTARSHQQLQSRNCSAVTATSAGCSTHLWALEGGLPASDALRSTAYTAQQGNHAQPPKASWLRFRCGTQR